MEVYKFNHKMNKYFYIQWYDIIVFDDKINNEI